MSVDAIARCSECGKPVFWKSLAVAPKGGGWADVEEQHYTCAVVGFEERLPHKVAMPKLTDRGALESWLQS